MDLQSESVGSTWTCKVGPSISVPVIVGSHMQYGKKGSCE